MSIQRGGVQAPVDDRRVYKSCLLIGWLVLALALAVASTASASTYTVADLGTLGGETSEASAINSAGEVAGTADTSYAQAGWVLRHAFRYKSGELTDLSPGPPGSGESCSGCTWGYAINGTGDVVGSKESSSGDEFPAVWRANGSTQPVPTPETDSIARGINGADEVVGGWDEGELPWLDTSEGSTTGLAFSDTGPGFHGGFAFAINDRGEVVGASAKELALNAFLYSGGTMHDLGTLGGEESRATALNESGTIVGYSDIAGGTAQHAFSYHEGAMTDLGTLPESIESEALAVNESDEIVGTSGGHAFLYRNGTMTDLNSLIPSTSGWTLTSANGINASGEIVGTGLHNGIKRALLLTPMPNATVSLASTIITVGRRGQAAITLTCTGTAPTCGGTLTLTAQMTVGRGRAKHSATVTLGATRGSIPSGATTTVALRLNATGRQLLNAAHGPLSVGLTILKSSPAPSNEATDAVTLA